MIDPVETKKLTADTFVKRGISPLPTCLVGPYSRFIVKKAGDREISNYTNEVEFGLFFDGSPA